MLMGVKGFGKNLYIRETAFILFSVQGQLGFAAKLNKMLPLVVWAWK